MRGSQTSKINPVGKYCYFVKELESLKALPSFFHYRGYACAET